MIKIVFITNYRVLHATSVCLKSSNVELSEGVKMALSNISLGLLSALWYRCPSRGGVLSNVQGASRIIT